MTSGRHALAPAIIRAWRVLNRPAVIRWMSTALLLAVAVVAGSLLVTNTRHSDRAGLAATILLAVLILALALARR
jgi:peptidoglycan/LPS O-acetylase OafA/YrhL